LTDLYVTNFSFQCSLLCVFALALPYLYLCFSVFVRRRLSKPTLLHQAL
jgi:hypothetical protein